MEFVLRSEGKIMKIYQGKKALERSKLRLQNGVWNDLRILGVEESMAKDRAAWKRLKNETMNRLQMAS